MGRNKSGRVGEVEWGNVKFEKPFVLNVYIDNYTDNISHVACYISLQVVLVLYETLIDILISLFFLKF